MTVSRASSSPFVSHTDGERFVVTADGSCLGNPGPGGWAWVISEDCWAAGGHASTTNNLMELRAVFEAVSAIPEDVPLLIQTDSSYVIGVFTEWLSRWEKNGWKTSAKKPVANERAIREIQRVLDARDVAWLHVPGHSGHEMNELADRFARAASESVRAGRQPDSGPKDCVTEAVRAWR